VAVHAVENHLNLDGHRGFPFAVQAFEIGSVSVLTCIICMG
jgi:hypothetical protein